MIRKALVEADGNRAEAARRLGIRRQLLYAKLRQYGLGFDKSGVPSGDILRLPAPTSIARCNISPKNQAMGTWVRRLRSVSI